MALDGQRKYVDETVYNSHSARIPTGCPCDHNVDFGRANELLGTFLARPPNGGPSGVFDRDVYSGTTTNPASAAAWKWLLISGVTQRTNNLVPSSFGSTDQPWLLVTRDPVTATQDYVYVGYDDFNANPPGYADRGLFRSQSTQLRS
jgi:hypothetical protein